MVPPTEYIESRDSYREENNETKHIYAIELTNSQRLELAELLVTLRDSGIVQDNINLGMFMRDAFYRGVNEYRKDRAKLDT